MLLREGFKGLCRVVDYMLVIEWCMHIVGSWGGVYVLMESCIKCQIFLQKATLIYKNLIINLNWSFLLYIISLCLSIFPKFRNYFCLIFVLKYLIVFRTKFLKIFTTHFKRNIKPRQVIKHMKNILNQSIWMTNVAFWRGNSVRSQQSSWTNPNIIFIWRVFHPSLHLLQGWCTIYFTKTLLMYPKLKECQDKCSTIPDYRAA